MTGSTDDRAPHWSMVINCADIHTMTQFWASALDLTPGPISPESDFRVLGGKFVVEK